MQKIIIPPVDYEKLETLQNLYTSLGNAIIRNKFSNIKVPDKLHEAIKEVEEQIETATNEVSSRLNTWKVLLGKYYKMRLWMISNGHEYEKISYIYPYRILSTNNTLWVLEVNANPDYANYNGGVRDGSITVDSDWNYQIELEEITSEEFEQHAINTVKYVIARRVNKIKKEQDHVAE